MSLESWRKKERKRTREEGLEERKGGRIDLILRKEMHRNS